MSEFDIVLRPATENDMALLFDWVNRSDSLDNKLATLEPISWTRHQAWFRERLADTDTALWMVGRQGEIIGQVRLQRRAGRLEVDIYIVAAARGTGVGETSLAKAAQVARQRWPGVALLARVKPANLASRRLFLAAGYTLVGDAAEQVVYEFRQPVVVGAQP